MSGDFIDCPLCRVKTPHHSISYVQSKKEPDFEFSDLIRNHSTKVTAVVSQLLSLIHEDPDVKVLIFSTVNISLLSSSIYNLLLGLYIFSHKLGYHRYK